MFKEIVKFGLIVAVLVVVFNVFSRSPDVVRSPKETKQIEDVIHPPTQISESMISAIHVGMSQKDCISKLRKPLSEGSYETNNGSNGKAQWENDSYECWNIDGGGALVCAVEHERITCVTRTDKNNKIIFVEQINKGIVKGKRN